MFKLRKLTFSQRIFGAMFLVILFTSVFIVIIIIYHFREQAYSYHEKMLRRKEQTVLNSIDYEMDRYPEIPTSENIYDILENSILGISYIHKVDINVFDVRGNLLISTEPESVEKRILPKVVLENLSRDVDYHEVPNLKGKKYLTSYSYLYNVRHEPVAIINLPYLSDEDFFKEEMIKLLFRFSGVILFVIVVGGYMSWIMANQITRKLRVIAAKIEDTDVVANNEPLIYKDNDEIKVLVKSYNGMLKKLNQQSELLARTEREEAWRDVAKQVAHEIKNPLTPMRLMIQNYIRKFDPNSPKLEEKTKSLANTLIQQIDLMSAISEAFSDFAKMPVRKDERVDAVQVARNAIEIFPEEDITFTTNSEEILIDFDKTYLTRIITNLTKNAFQSIPFGIIPEVGVSLVKSNNELIIRISDNGIGIPEHLESKIFEPKFTTKSGGMGVGLAMVKKIVEDYHGSIEFLTEEGEGTIFTIKFPYEEKDKSIPI